MTDDELFQRLDKDLENIRKDVQHLLFMQFIFSQVQKLVRQNQRLQRPSSFYDWMAQAYAYTVAIGVRRHLDYDNRSYSLVRLLKEVMRKPETLSRKRYVSMYSSQDPNLAKRVANREFDKLVGVPGNLHVDIARVYADLQRFKTMAEKLKPFVNKRIAHFDRKGPKTIPTFRDLDDSVEIMKCLVEKYSWLFRCKCGDITPVLVDDWRAIFREPWIPARESLESS